MINVWYMGSPFCTGNAAVAALTIEVSILHSLPEVARGLLWAWNVSTINKRATVDVARWDLLAGKLLISCGRDSLDGLFGLRPSGDLLTTWRPSCQKRLREIKSKVLSNTSAA